MRWLGVDAGLARVGLAISDPEQRYALPLEIVPAQAAFPAIRAIIRREGIGGVVVGLPLTMSGDERDAARMARRLGERIERSLAIPVEYEDERLTSVEAERLGTGASRDAHGHRDDLAAALILQQFLDRHRDQNARRPEPVE